MSKKLLFIVALFSMSLCLPIYSAEPLKVILDIRQVLKLVEEQNKDVSVARQNVRVSEQGVRVANVQRLPDITSSLNVNYLGNLTIMDRDFSHGTNVSMPHLSNGLEVSLYQPFYTGGAISSGIKLAESKVELSQWALEQTRQSIGMQAIGCYLELFKAHNLRNVYNENINMTQQLLANMEAKRDEGVVLKNDITRYELRLSTLNYDLLTINNRLSVLNHDLCLLLGLQEGTEVVTNLNDDLSRLPDLESAVQWYTKAIDNAPSLKMLDVEQHMNSHQYRLIKSEKLPHIGFVAYNKLAGPIDFEVPVINNNYNMYFIGVNVKYNFSSLFKTSKSLVQNRNERKQIALKREAQEEHLNRTMENLYTQCTQAYQMLDTESKNVELATENYRVVENRYNNQLALLTDMLDASTAKLDAEVRLVNARVNIIYYYYQLKFNSGIL